MDEFIKAVERQLKSREMSIAELSRQSGIHRVHLHRILNQGHSPSFDTAEKIARVLNLKITVGKG